MGVRVFDLHTRCVFPFVPTSCSWLNAVEGFFAKLSKRRLKRGIFRSLVDLQAAINRFVAEHNTDPKPFTWTARPDKIIAAVKRGHQALASIHEGCQSGRVAPGIDGDQGQKARGEHERQQCEMGPGAGPNRPAPPTPPP